MVRCMAYWICVFLLAFNAQAQVREEAISKQELQRYLNSQGKASKRSSDLNIDINKVHLTIQVNMNNARIEKASVNFKFISLSSISVIDFDLRNELTVDSVIYHGQAIAFTHNIHLLNCFLPQTLGFNVSDSLKVFYHGTPNMSSRAYSRIVNASGPAISTLSEPYGASYWWPCRDNLKDKIEQLDVDLIVDTPYTAASNGVLKSIRTLGAKRQFHFEHRYPIATYLVAIAFANYNVYAQLAYLGSINQNLPLVNYVYAHNDLNNIQNQTASTIPIMSLFDSLFGTYPFANEQYGHVQFSWGGGMEHQTMSFMVNFNYDLIAHELAHQWFGDQVTCANWKSIWLNESFATYTNLLCYDFLKKPSDFRQRIIQFQNDVMSAPGGAVFKQDTTDANQLFDYRTTYQKGAMVLHQLRWVLGDSIFFAAIRNYLADPLTRYRFADQDQLRVHFESLCNCSLADYFDDWIMGEGYPNYHLIWRQSGTSLSIELNQTNSMNNSIEYNVPIPVLVKGAFKDTLLVLPVNQLHQTQNFTLPFVVKDIECDPDHHLLAKFKVNGTYISGSNVNVYPNPFSNHLYLWHEKESIKHWSLYAANGQLVKQDQTDLMPGDVLDITFADLAQGIYTIQFGNSSNIFTQKIIYIKP